MIFDATHLQLTMKIVFIGRGYNEDNEDQINFSSVIMINHLFCCLLRIQIDMILLLFTCKNVLFGN